jgi:hypothetical protein
MEKLNSNKLYDLYSVLNTVKSREVRWMGHRFLIIYYSTFPKKTISKQTKKKTNWITSDIRNFM